MKQYVIRHVLLIAALVAFPTSHANARSQPEINRQAAKDFEKADAELNKTYEALLAKLPDAESKQKLKEASAHGSPFAMPRQRLQLIRRVAGQWLLQSVRKP